jgi:hypothetical protein
MDTQIKQQYIVTSWQGLMQQLVFLAGQGYTFYHVIYLPKEKVHKFPAIDTKLIAKYQTNVSKYQRYRLKQKNRANFMYLRWEHIAVILHTNGDIGEIKSMDSLKSLRDQSMAIQLSKYLSLTIVWDNGKTTVKLHKESYRTFKMMIEGYAKQQLKRKIIETIQKLNGIPAYKGVYVQKESLVEYAIKQLAFHGTLANKNEFRLLKRRKLYKVFE